MKEESWFYKHPYFTVFLVLIVLGIVYTVIRTSSPSEKDKTMDNVQAPTYSNLQNSNSISDKTNSQTQLPAWHEVITFTGSNNKNTDTFQIKGEKFKLTYTIKGLPDNRPDDSRFSVYSFTPGSTSYTSYASLTKEGTDSSTVYKGSGEYYLQLNTANLQSWSVKVEDYY